MTFSLTLLFAISAGFLLLLFGIAAATNRNYIPKRISSHPAVFIAALGVYASAWTFYGTIGLAQNYGYAYLAAYFGASLTFVLAPVILQPLLRITKSYQLSSVADLFAFRFRSQLAGTLVTILILLASLPLIATQIEAVTDSIRLLSGEQNTDLIAMAFCATTALFSVLFGTRHPSVRHRTAGLVTAMAAGVVFKLIAMVALGLFAIYGVFGSNAEMEQWLARHAIEATSLYKPVEGDYWRTLLFGFMASAVVAPHMFHLLFTENSDARALNKASWGFPLLLLLLSAAIPPVLWAGLALDIPGRPEYFGLLLGLHTNAPWLTMLTYIGGLSAAAGLIILCTIALAGMVLNHLVLPYVSNHNSEPLYNRLVLNRRLLILQITLLSYLFYLATNGRAELHHMGLIAFIAFMQFLPGLLATLFWPGGNRQGFILGLLLGMGIWLLSMLMPLLPESSRVALELNSGNWHEVATLALAANVIVFLMISSLNKPSQDERLAANSCVLSALHRPQSTRPPLADVPALIQHLSERLGDDVAHREVAEALQQLQLSESETNPQAIEQLQDQLEHNLSALLGPVEAFSVMSLEAGDNRGYRRRDIHLLESHLEQSRSRLSGLAAELDELRQLHRTTLQRMPVGVCSLGEAGEILLWNVEMEQFTGVPGAQVIGHRLEILPPPWRELLSQFAEQPSNQLLNQRLTTDNQARFFSLHKASLHEQRLGALPPTQSNNFYSARLHPHAGQVLLLEDQTENQLLADELAHSERLASIGRLAAGVAHEVGNPITGIACLAQNLKYETDQDEINQTGEQILQQTARVDNIIKSLMSFAHTGTQYRPGAQQPLSLNLCVEQAIELVRLDSRRKQLNYLNLCDSGLQLHGDMQRLLQVFINLLNNAADASEDGQTIRIESEQSNDSLQVHIVDQGSGIPKELQSRLFEPFFTTKEPGEGTGLGLALIYNIIEEHYGSIQIESPADVEQNRGTRVTLTLPRAQDLSGSNREND
ncbi:ATP-binding protein [Motiliproteus sp.]|uniref:sensor histidine kinase n=1 Tax=Motiliproteus sp. TaxID=1898955 RepID=UPI003BAD06F8